MRTGVPGTDDAPKKTWNQGRDNDSGAFNGPYIRSTCTFFAQIWAFG